MTDGDRSRPGPVPLIVDTDGGVDDAVALWFAATTPDVDLRAVTVVHGNVSVEAAAANVCLVLEAAGRREVPVVVGADGPLGPVPPLRRADFIHGSDGLGDTFRPPASFAPVAGVPIDEVVADIASSSPDVRLVTLGPLTNIALLARQAPDVIESVDRLVVMGGAVTVGGNALPGAEANIAHDPVAAAEVVTAPWRRPPLLVGLDVTHRATFTASEVEVFSRRAGSAARFLADPLAFYARAAGTFCAPGEFPCHDLLAVMAAVRPVVSGPVLPLAVQTQPGPAWAATVADRRVPFFERAGAGSQQASLDGFAPWEIGLEVDVTAFRAALRTLAAHP